MSFADVSRHAETGFQSKTFQSLFSSFLERMLTDQGSFGITSLYRLRKKQFSLLRGKCSTIDNPGQDFVAKGLNQFGFLLMKSFMKTKIKL